MVAPGMRSTEFDPFHDGEALARAIAIERGAVPYRDVVMVHGVGEDAVRPSVAFRLLGRRIGALRTIESTASVLAVTLFGLVLYEALGHAGMAALAIIAMVALRAVRLLPEALQILPPIRIVGRDVVTFAVMLAALRLLRRATQGRVAGPAAVALGFIGTAGFIYAVDRAVFACAFAAVAAAGSSLVLKGRKRLLAVTLTLAGAAVGTATVWLALGPGFGSFIDFTFFTFRAYKELIDGLPVPIASAPFALALLLAAGLVFVLVYRLFGGARIEMYPEAALLLLSLLFFRKALGRANLPHLSEAMALLYAAGLCMLSARLRPRHDSATTGVVLGTVVLSVWIAGALRFAWAGKAFPGATPDSATLPVPMSQAARVLRNVVPRGERFFVLEANPSWYYFLGQRPPVRFPEPWLAGTLKHQRELAHALELTRPRYIVYRSRWGLEIDGITTETRLPLLVTYVRSAYRPVIDSDAISIWVRRFPASSGQARTAGLN